MPHRHHILRSLMPAAPLARTRLGFLVLSGLSAIVLLPGVLAADQPLALEIVAAVGGVGLVVHWVAGYRRGAFPAASEPLEAFAAFTLLALAPGEPFLPIFGLVFRSLYGGAALATLRYVLWTAALLVAHAPRDSGAAVQADVTLGIGLAMVPVLMPALRTALQRIEASERRLASLVQNSTDVVTVVDADLRVLWQAESIRSVLGQEPRAVIDTSLLDLVHEDDREEVRTRLADTRDHTGAVITLALRLRHRQGGWRHFEVVVSNRLHDESVGGFVLNMRDATERNRLERDLRSLVSQREHDAMHDPLTGLPNRRKLFGTLDDEITRARRDRTEVALLMVDLDRFKELNDTLGHAAGDQLLRELRPRLIAAAPEAEVVARLGGDEFAVVMPLEDGVACAEQVAERLRQAIEQPFSFRGLTLLVGASVGISTFPDHGDDVETLVQRADIAMYSAKRHGVGHEVYDAARDVHSTDRLALMGELPQAIARRELVVHYQPKVDLPTGAVTGVEALVRWAHPERGLLGPGTFLPLAEQAGLMRALTLDVLEQAIEQSARWAADGFDLTVAVNLSAANVLDAGLPEDVDALLSRFDVHPSRLQLEITETIIAADPIRVGEIVGRLGDLGVTLSLDDFGTGSSSLSYLRRLPVQELKIDKSFVLAMDDDDRDATVVRAVIDLAHNLGLRAVAEGIESADVLERLCAYGCDDGQGFLLGRPVAADELSRGILARSEMPVRPTVAA